MRIDRIEDREGERDDLDGLDDDETIVDSPEERARKLLKVVLVAVVVVPLTLLMVVFLRPEGTLKVERWPNGYTRFEATWRSSPTGPERHGPAREFHENGRLAAEGEYANGEREGVWRFFDAAGQPDTDLTGTYRAGTLLEQGLP